MKDIQITRSITNRESRSVETYFNDLGRIDMITPQEEAMLAQKIRQGDRAALHKLTKANLRFVVSVAKKFQNYGLPLCDLINEGNMGLITAAERFDETRGFKFISFAVWWIRQSIMLAIAEHARTVRLPMNKINEITRINRAAERLEQENEREPTLEQLCDHLEMEPQRVSEALAIAPKSASFDVPLYPDDDFSLFDILQSELPSADHALNQSSLEHDFQVLLSVLSPGELRIIVLSFGLGGGREMSAAEIAANINVNAEKIRQVRKQALKKLKEKAPAILFN